MDHFAECVRLGLRNGLNRGQLKQLLVNKGCKNVETAFEWAEFLATIDGITVSSKRTNFFDEITMRPGRA